MAFKKYLEIIEQNEDEKVGAKIVKIEVADKSEAESKIANAEKGFEGKKYTVRYHICRHGEHGKNQPCSVEILKEVKCLSKS